MKVTITADTGAQDIEITRCPDRRRTADPIADQADRLRLFDGALTAAVDDVRRAAGLPAEYEPGAILVAWQQVRDLVGADRSLSPASVVERVSEAVDAVHREAKAATR